jgi:hypothetical protein
MTASASNSKYFGDNATCINAVAINRKDSQLKALLVIPHDDGKELSRGKLCFSLIKISNIEPTPGVEGLYLPMAMAKGMAQYLRWFAYIATGEERCINLGDGRRHLTILRVEYHEQWVLHLTPSSARLGSYIGKVWREAKPTKPGRSRPNLFK